MSSRSIAEDASDEGTLLAYKRDFCYMLQWVNALTNVVISVQT